MYAYSRKPVFVGSTYEDLIAHRKAVCDAILGFDLVPSMMEYLPAMDTTAVNACMKKIDEAGIYIGVFAHRYGFCPTGSDISITEMEFDRARNNGLQCLCFLVDEDEPWLPKYIEGEPGKSKLQRFKAKIDSTLVRGKFTTPENLEIAVSKALQVLLRERSSTHLKIGSYSAYDVTSPVDTDVIHGVPRAKLQIFIEGEISSFDSSDLRNALCDMLGIRGDDIKIQRVIQGSIVVQIELPLAAANELYDLAHRTQIELSRSSKSVHTLDLDREIVLDPAIVGLEQPVNLTVEPSNIFLTAGTGFLSAYLLGDLLENTDAKIYTLVRTGTRFQGMNRIRRNMSSYLLWRDDYEKRIIPVPGDLKYPRLGLSPAQFDLLGQTVDVIYHAGSKLSYIAPYEFLKAANVGGTQETLRLAVQGKAKPYHFVSSLGVIMADTMPKGGMENDLLDVAKCPEVGYFQSKYVAEGVVRIARSRGIPVTIYRVGLIVGDSKNGYSNDDDLVGRILIGSIQAGYGLDIKGAMDMTPVDYAAKAIVYLSSQQASLGKVFHLLNPQPTTWSEIFDFVTEAGYPIKKLPFAAWTEAIEQYGDRATNPLHPLLPFFHLDVTTRMFGLGESAYQALNRDFTERALIGLSANYPLINQRLINNFLARFAQSGRLGTKLVEADRKLTS